KPDLTGARRNQLESEKRMLTEGGSALEQERGRTQEAGLATALARKEQEIKAAQTGLGEPPATPSFDAQMGLLTAKQDILQSMTERELRRIAGRQGIGLPPDQISAMAQTILAATPETARDAIWPALGDIAKAAGKFAEEPQGARVVGTPEDIVANT